MIKILFNCTTNIVGGGIKNSALFIKYVLEHDDIVWSFAVSPQVKALLDQWQVAVSKLRVFESSPAKSFSSRKMLLEYEKSLGVDAVYTMAGPSYVKFSSFHIQGISNPHITHVKFSDLRFIVKPSSLFKYIFFTAYRSYFSRKADVFLFQTESSRTGFCKRLRVSPAKTEVVSNAVDFSAFEGSKAKEVNKEKGPVVILCPAAPYSHKALELIPTYAKALKDRGWANFRFDLTISDEHSLFQRVAGLSVKLGVSEMVKTRGAYSYHEVSSVYAACDIVFVPSLLETFSATYLEAFAACRPLVVANRDFSREVCGEAARYVEPHNTYNVVAQLIDLADGQDLKSEMVQVGQGRLNLFGGQKTRTDKLLQVIKRVLKERS